MDKGSLIVLVSVFLPCAFSQKCPVYWYGYGSSNKCYRFMYGQTLSWQDARDMCSLHGGDLLKVESVAERTWIYNQISYLKNHSKIPSTKWWVGLNNREFLTIWEWADGSAVTPNVINWHPGEPNNHGGNERCGEINNSEFNDQECTDQNRYICSRYRSVPLKCDTDGGWQPVNGQCFKVFPSKTSWYNAKQNCDHNGGSMVTIKTQDDETVIHDFAINLKQELWIGLFSVQQPGNTIQWQWTDNTLMFTNYWHGTPHVDSSHLNNSCVVMSNNVAQLQAWTIQPCSQTRAYVCRKPEGVCFPGWIGHSSYCYQFNAQYRMSFDDATSYCQNQGGELLRYRSDTTTQFINSYLREMRDSGATSFWIGASDNNVDLGPYKWRKGQAVTYKIWATPNNTPTNTKGQQDCVYVSATDRNGKWRITSNCRTPRAFVCMIPMGATVTPATATPSLHYGCPTNWRRYTTLCYRIFDQAFDWVTARTQCQQTPGADLAAIRSKAALDFVNHNAAPGIQYWIGLNDRTQEGVYVWNDETSQTTFTSWQPKQPNNWGETQNCIVQVDGQWGDYPCNNKKRYICYKDANSIINILPPPTPAADWTVKCGPGWESNPLTTKCYMFVDQPLVWVNALDMCKSNQGDLVDIETLEELNYLAGRLHSMNSIGVWTGLNDRSTEQGWEWTSKKPFAFLNWAAGQPSPSGQGTDCVVMYTSSGEWDDVNCIQRNGYICEKEGNVPTTKPPATTTQKIPAGMVLGCRSGWKPYGTNCYLFRRMTSGINWMDAQTMCGRYSGKLATIQNKNEQDFITANLWTNPKKSWDGIWIGLNDRQIESRFQWSDGSTVQYTNWNVGEPNSWMNRNEDCVFVYLNNSHWNDERCETKIGGYICKAPKVPVSTTQGPFQIGCPRGAQGYYALCYNFIASGKTWSDANSYCNKTYHGTLATVNDRFIQGFLSSQLLYRTGHYWLGLSDTVKTGTYVWASGESVQYTNWHNTHQESATNSCVGMMADQPIGLWEDLQCQSKQNFICQFPRTSGFSTVPTTPTPYPNVPCPPGWTALRGKCLKAFLGKTNLLTWMDARTFCQSLGGDLPSFHGNANDSLLATLLTQNGYNIWIGLNDRDTEAGYKWSDGSAVDYTNWAKGEPNNYEGNEDCTVYYTSSDLWNDYNCYATNNFLCAIPRGATLPATTIIPQPQRSAQCGSNPNWYFFNQNCYLLPPPSGDNATLNWYDANDYCNGMGSHLASIHNVDEEFFLFGLVKPTSLTGYWIGLNELALNGYSWTDKTPVDYVEWMPGEPNNYFGAERCVELYNKFDGHWNDNNCGFARGYICKKSINGQVVIPTAAPYPSGGCANGFTRVPGGRNKCFYLNSNKLNWTAARDQCQKFGKGYDIASIEDLYEQDFFMSMAKGVKDAQFWIGLTDRLANNLFIWQDNSPLVFTHWGRGEPTSSHPNNKNAKGQDCVAIRNWLNHEGEWTDMDCSALHGSVCQTKQDPTIPINPPSGGCRSGYMPWRQGCYKISTDAKSWSDAKTACQQDGGALTSINDVYESGFVYTLASSKGEYWIGLSDEAIHGLYGWTDGWPVKYTNWGKQQPSYDGGCVKAGPGNDRWNDTDCSQQRPYVCKITSVKPPTTNPTPPGNCSDPSWIPHGGFCYKAFVNAKVSWPEANFQCEKSGMELISVHSKEEMDFIFTLVGQAQVKDPNYKPNIWLGLSKGLQGSFAWSDNSAVNFLFWNPGEPSGLGIHKEIEECVEFNRGTEKWNDISCFSNRGYVCKAVKGVSSLQTYLQLQSGSGGNNSSGLSSGAIAGIVLGCICVVIFIILVLIFLNCKGAVKIPKFNGNAGFDNQLYNIESNARRIDSDA